MQPPLEISKKTCNAPAFSACLEQHTLSVNYNGRTVKLNDEAYEKAIPLFKILIGFEGNDVKLEIFSNFTRNDLLNLRITSVILLCPANTRIIQLWNECAPTMKPPFLQHFKALGDTGPQMLFPNLKTLNIDFEPNKKPKTFDEDVQNALTHLPNLEMLSLCQISNKTIPSFSNLTRLNSLSLSRWPIKRVSFSVICQLTQLKNLNFYDCTFSQFNLIALTKLSLTRLSIYNPNYLNNDDFDFLEHMTSLTYLNVQKNPLAHGEGHLGKLVKLQELLCPYVSYDQLRHLTNLQYLKIECIHATQVKKYPLINTELILDLSDTQLKYASTLDTLIGITNFKIIFPAPETNKNFHVEDDRGGHVEDDSDGYDTSTESYVSQSMEEISD